MENVRSEDRTYLQEFPQIMPDQLHITVPALKITENIVRIFFSDRFDPKKKCRTVNSKEHGSDTMNSR